jgi:hypothetical protein
MTSLLWGKKKFLWTAAVNCSFQYLKTVFLDADILKYFDSNLVVVLEVNTSNGAIAECLSQVDISSELLHSVAFYSRKFTPTEEKYDIGDKELLAIVECLWYWRVYLEGAIECTKVYSDHSNFQRFTTTKVLNCR